MATNGHWTFLWGGVTADGVLTDEGLLIDLASGRAIEIPASPLEPRMGAASIWTGQEFVVVGGYTFERSFGNGAAFDPGARAWRTITNAPFEDAPFPAVMREAAGFYVWASNEPYEFASVPRHSQGVFAFYDLDSNSWTSLAPPDRPLNAPALMMSEDGVTLVGGPPLQDIGTGANPSEVFMASFDPGSGTWGNIVTGPQSEAASAARAPDGNVVVLTHEGTLLTPGSDEWQALIPDRILCPFNHAIESSESLLFVRGCSILMLQDGVITPVLDAGHDLSRIGNAAQMRAAPGDRLVLVGPVDGQLFIGVYESGTE